MPDRLVIRVKLPPRPTPEAPPSRRSSRSALLILGAIAILLTVLGISMFRSETPTRAPVATETSPKPQRPATVTAPSAPSAAVSNAPPPQEQPAALPSPTNEAIPAVPRSALDTIRGTIRVSIRVIVDKQGTVLAATTDEPGPSRYFERLALASAKEWTFTPAASQEQRVMLVRFNFKRAGVTARAIPVQ